jgi:hypothetical protein
MSRLFTREEAQETLPIVAPLLWELQRMNERLTEATHELAGVQSKMAGNGHGIDTEASQARTRHAEASAEIAAMVERVTSLGIEVKDISIGLIDFRSERDGRIVYLCWKLGEENVDWWHEQDTGFAGRQPLD